MSERLTLRVLEGRYAVCRLPAAATIPSWATTPGFSSVTRTAEECSVVCRQTAIPPGVAAERDWAVLQVVGPLDFALTGILAGLVGPLAEAGIAVFTVSTYDTDYILVRETKLAQSVEILRRHHQVRWAGGL